MRKWIYAFLLLLVWLSCGKSVYAQTAYAPGGLFIHPTAYTPHRGTFSLYMAGFDQYEDEGKQDNYIPLSLSYSPTDRLMVSALAVYHDGFDHPRHIHVGGFVKYQLVSDAPTHPALALTGTYVGNDHLQEAVAGVLSHAFIRRGRLLLITHAGVKWGETGDPGHASDVGGFLGLEVPLSSQFRLVGETSTRMKFDLAPASAIGLMWRSRSGTGITIGYANTGRSSRMGFFFGVGIALGGLK